MKEGIGRQEGWGEGTTRGAKGGRGLGSAGSYFGGSAVRVDMHEQCPMTQVTSCHGPCTGFMAQPSHLTDNTAQPPPCSSACPLASHQTCSDITHTCAD